MASFSDSVKGLFAGGSSSNVIDFVTIASTGNASDFGDLTAEAAMSGLCNRHGGIA